MKKVLIISLTLGILGVIIGAMGAHALKPHLTPEQMSWINKGVFYQFVHVLAAISGVLLYKLFDKKSFLTSSILFIIGIMFFSGSLYLLALRDILDINHWNWLGPITPLGGITLIIGWMMLIIGALKIEN